MSNNQLDGRNAQKVLDTPWFRELNVDDQIRFIQQYKQQIGQAPKLSFGKVLGSGLELGGVASFATLSHQLMSQAGKGFKPNYWALGAAGVLGGLVGSAVEYKNSQLDYNRDRKTAVNIDDAIGTLVHRIGRPPITRQNITDRIEKDMVDMPISYGKTLSAIDFSKLDPKK